MVAPLTPFGVLADGRTVTEVRLAAGGRSATIVDYGARLVAFRADDGPSAAVSADLAGYEGVHRFTGPVVGPVINRIAGAGAVIEGRAHTFEANESARHTLHSGAAGTHAEIWQIADTSGTHVTFRIDLPDGAGGFTGNRCLSATYKLDATGALTLELTAITDASTLMNPGHHGVWNPEGAGGAADLLLEIPSDRYLPTDSDKIPNGRIAPVDGTPYDHRKPQHPDPTLDHNYCFETGMGLRACLSGAAGRTLEIHSDAPGLQAYAGGSGGVALEPQLWPDAPHHAHFPSILLRPGETFRQVSRFILNV